MGTPSQAAHLTTEESRREFESLCRRLTTGENHFFGRRQIETYQEFVATHEADPERRLGTRIELGFHWIRVGEHEKAIEILESALAEAEVDGISPKNPLFLSAMSHLAIAHLQLSEDQNCLALHTAASCILPVSAEAVHRRPRHSAAAGDLYQRYLELAPDAVQARWLLNLARMISGAYPNGVPEALRLPADAFPSVAGMVPWRDLGSGLGLSKQDLAGGAVMDDFDGDGLLDLISSSWDPCEPMKAFRNDGQGGFEDVSTRWGLDAQWGGLNLLQADFDNDGRLDLLVLRGAWLGDEGRQRNSLLRNDLGGAEDRFLDVTSGAGLAYPAYPTQAAAWGDFDLDGDLDLFVGNEAGDSLGMMAGEVTDPYPSQLFRNNGDGTFTDVARATGLVNGRFAKGAAWGDIDNDGDLDLYVSNFGANRLYRNQEGAFEDIAMESGVTEPSAASFATWFFDYDNDGWLDIFVNDYSAAFADVSASNMGLATAGGNPRVFRNTGAGFLEVSSALGLKRPHLPMGANYGDLDNDGWLDFYLGTGVPNFEALMPNVMYRNLRGGGFQDVSFATGLAHLQKGHGVAFGDVDNDGDQDLFHQLGGAFPFDAYGNALFQNPGNDNQWLVLRFQGRETNRFGLGVRISIRLSGGETTPRVHRQVGSGGSFGGSSLQQEIGLGDATSIEILTVEWPVSGRRQVFKAVEPNKFYLVVEGEPHLRELSVEAFGLQPTQRH